MNTPRMELNTGSAQVRQRVCQALDSCDATVNLMTLSTDERTLVTCILTSQNGMLGGAALVWSLIDDAPAMLHSLKCDGEVSVLGFSIDGKSLVTGDGSGSVIEWDLASGSRKQTLRVARNGRLRKMRCKVAELSQQEPDDDIFGVGASSTGTSGGAPSSSPSATGGGSGSSSPARSLKSSPSGSYMSRAVY